MKIYLIYLSILSYFMGILLGLFLFYYGKTDLLPDNKKERRLYYGPFKNYSVPKEP